MRSGSHKTEHALKEKEGARYPESEIDFHGNVLNKKAKEFYQRHGTAVVQQAFEKLIELDGLQVMTTKHCIKFEFGGCKLKKGVRDIPDGPLYLKDAGQVYRVEFDCTRCEMKIFFEKRRI